MTRNHFSACLLAGAVALLGAASAASQTINPPPQAAANASVVSRARAENAADRALTTLPEDFAQLKLAPGFLVSLEVLDDPDYSGTFRIDQNGDLALPILGAVHVGGETASDARVQIQKLLLDRQLMRNPQVNLDILQYSLPQVTILGEVTSPGRYPLIVPRKLIDVLALAGGTLPAAGDEVTITPADSQAKPRLIHYSQATNASEVENILVQPGDTIQVKRAGIVYVLGAVTRPGGYIMQEEGNLTLLQAISMANGTTLPASVKTIYVLRKNPDGTEVDIAIPYSKLTHGKRPDVALSAQDVVYVPTSKVKAVLINGAGILAATASASIYAAAIY